MLTCLSEYGASGAGGMRRLAACAVAALVLLLALPAPLSAADRENIFGSTGVRLVGANLRAVLPQWQGVIDGMNRTPEPWAEVCELPAYNLCELKKWTPFLKSLKGLDEMTQLKRVNDYMNNIPYLQDARWETPLEFLRLDGMCRDYAVAKFWSLRYLGWPSDRLRIVVLDILDMPDGNSGRPTSHAVLVAHMNDRDLVLDNLHKGYLVDARSIVDYRPTYAATDRDIWVFSRR